MRSKLLVSTLGLCLIGVIVGVVIGTRRSAAPVFPDRTSSGAVQSNHTLAAGNPPQPLVRPPSPPPKENAEPPTNASEHAAAADERTKIFTKNVERAFGLALTSLQLSPEVLKQVKHLLVERAESRADAHDIATRTFAANRDEAPPLPQTIQRAEGDVEQQLLTVVDPATYAKIKEMLVAEDYLSRLQVDYAPQFLSAGQPLTAEQLLPLATVMHEAYAFDAVKNPHASTVRLQSIDPDTGLSTVDQQVVQRAGNILSPTQLKVLAAALAAATQRLAKSADAPKP